MDKAKILRLCSDIENAVSDAWNSDVIEYGLAGRIVSFAQKIAAEISEPPKTNADRIRQMTDEELAEWFAPHMRCNICDKKDMYGCDLNECKKYALAYMKKEEREDAGAD